MILMLQNGQTFQSFRLYLIEIRGKRCSAPDGMLNSNCSIRYIYSFFISVRLSTNLGVHNIRAIGVLNNANALSLGTNSCKK